jgi:xanthine/uracil permease
MMSGIATICFLLIVQGKVPSYLGTSASFVGAVVAIRAQEGATSATVTGAILIAGVVLALVGVAIHFLGSGVLHKVLPPVVTGAVVMLIGFNLAPVVANIYWPQDQWIALLVMTFTIVCPPASGRAPSCVASSEIASSTVAGRAYSTSRRSTLRFSHTPP